MNDRIPPARLAAWLFVAALWFVAPAAAGVCYVNGTASGSNNGSNWANAYINPQGALGNSACTEIWVAAGTYYPTATTDSTISFIVKPGVSVYGGFAGNETVRVQRDPRANPTTLSGAISATPSGYSNHIVLLDGTTASGTITASTVVDGFTITDGNATVFQNDSGGGLYCKGSGSNHGCSPTLSNLTFSNDSAGSYGGALYLDASSGGNSSPSISNVTFKNNSAYYGGAVMVYASYGGTARPTLTDITFANNSATYGGGMANVAAGGYSPPNPNSICTPTLTNVTFSGNSSPNGAAMYQGADPSGSPSLPYDDIQAVVTNGILWGDTGSYEVVDTPDVPQYAWVSNHTIIQSGLPNNANENYPVYGDPTLGALADNGGTTLTFLPASGSAAINAGTNNGCPITDQRGVPRPQGPGCDVGAVETTQLCYVNALATGNGNGASWANAYTDLQSALAGGGCGEIWVAMGTYRPTSGTNPSISFQIAPTVAVYGGFAGNETQRSQRDPEVNHVILSGDIGVSGNSSDNSYHVVVIDATTANGPVDSRTLLDGFTITNGGNATGFTTPDDRGGGLYCNGVGSRCNPTLKNLRFHANQAINYGGALAADGRGGMASPLITACTFDSNTTFAAGGAIFLDGSSSGIASPILTNDTFVANQVTQDGGAIGSTGNSGASNPVITNATFSGNVAGDRGGALYSVAGTGQDNPTLVNDIFWGDTATNADPEIYNVAGATPLISYSDVQGSGGSGSNWNASLGNDGGSNWDTNPSLGTLADNGGSTPTLLIGPSSVAIGHGNPAACPPTDQRGVRRPQSSICDMGAVELVTDRIFADGFDGVPVP